MTSFKWSYFLCIYIISVVIILYLIWLLFYLHRLFILYIIKNVCDKSYFLNLCPELKAEVEKLRAAQMSSQGIEPEKMRLFQQEIASLKTKLSQQEHEMAEAHRCVETKLRVMMKIKIKASAVHNPFDF